MGVLFSSHAEMMLWEGIPYILERSTLGLVTYCWKELSEKGSQI